MNQKSLRGSLLLLLGSVIWGAAFAAQRMGIGTVIAPRENERDAEDVPEPLRAKIEFVWVDRVEISGVAVP